METLLNLIWLSLSIFLVLALGGAPSKWESRGGPPRLSKRLAALFLIVIFVFPCISASDDLWSFQNLHAVPESRRIFQSCSSEANEHANGRLAHFFESLQSLTISKPWTFARLLCFLGLIASPTVLVAGRDLVRNSGRSPPGYCSPV
jgi:hypothetical protein